MESRINRTWKLQGPDSAEKVQEIIGPLKKVPKDRFFKENPGNSLGRIHRSVTHVKELLWAIANSR